jgi:hypothetical protein
MGLTIDSHLPWNWLVLSRNKNLDWNIFKANPDKLWDWWGLSPNPNITWECVQDNPGRPWKWYH